MHPFNEVQLPICHHLLYNIGVVLVLVLGPVWGLAGGTLEDALLLGNRRHFLELLCRFLFSFHYCCFSIWIVCLLSTELDIPHVLERFSFVYLAVAGWKDGESVCFLLRTCPFVLP